MIGNPKDPLQKAGPPPAQELFKRFSKEADGGFSAEDVVGAASNLLINGLRQAYPTRAQAEARFDELFGKLKSLLLEHYDSVTGKRRSVFPFDQTINVPKFDFRTQLKKD